MHSQFESLFARTPLRIENGVYLFGQEQDGDNFDETDAAIWNGGVFHDRWHSSELLQNSTSRKLIDGIAAQDAPVIDLACGPGMGLIPSVKQLTPDLPCLASDANALVLNEWQRYLRGNAQVEHLDFAQFSVLDIPLRDHSVQAYSSFIGLSSTRAGESGYAQALAEVRRTLHPEGRLYTIENEWTDIPGIVALFKRAGMTPWQIFCQPHKTWRQRFAEAGLRIISEETYMRRNLRPEDNELGELAARFGVEVGMIFTAYIVARA